MTVKYITYKNVRHIPNKSYCIYKDILYVTTPYLYVRVIFKDGILQRYCELNLINHQYSIDLIDCMNCKSRKDSSAILDFQDKNIKCIIRVKASARVFVYVIMLTETEAIDWFGIKL